MPMNRVLVYFIVGLGVALSSRSCFSAEIVVVDNIIRLRAGVLTREIHLDGVSIRTKTLDVDSDNLLACPSRELAMRVRKAQPNRRPVGLRPGEGETIDSIVTFQPDYREDPARWEDLRPNATRWIDPIALSSDDWADMAGSPKSVVHEPMPGVHRLAIQVPLAHGPSFGQLEITLYYELYDGHPVIRKWVKVRNEGDCWLMLDRLTLDDLDFAAPFRYATPLTPAGRGAESSVIAFDDEERSRGVIAVSEVPSALRSIHKTVTLGYREDLFE